MSEQWPGDDPICKLIDSVTGEETTLGWMAGGPEWNPNRISLRCTAGQLYRAIQWLVTTERLAAQAETIEKIRKHVTT